MSHAIPDWAVLILITFVAATVNGALGYGFSSITVPVALLYYPNRTLNPVLVVVELFVNLYVLVLSRESLPRVWRRIRPLMLGILPGVLVGSYVLTSASSGGLKVLTYACLLPLVLLQAAGYRRYLRSEQRVAAPLGVAVGALYSLTTISGPPLALFLNNQGFVKNDFKACLAVIRLTEGTLTLISYAALGLLVPGTTRLLSLISPGVLAGILLGALVVRRLPAETFRRICMTFDAWCISFGLFKLLPGWPGHTILLVTILLDAWLLRAYFLKAARVPVAPPAAALA